MSYHRDLGIDVRLALWLDRLFYRTRFVSTLYRRHSIERHMYD